MEIIFLIIGIVAGIAIGWLASIIKKRNEVSAKGCGIARKAQNPSNSLNRADV